MGFYGNNTWTASSTSSSTGILWMGSGGEGGTTTCTSATATISDCYMWVGETQALNAYDHQMAANQQQQYNQMQAAAQMQQYNWEVQRNTHEALQREVQLRHEAEQQRTQPAKNRAKELLLTHLTPAQKETFEKNKWFIVEGGKSKQRYRIRTNSQAMNIEVMDGEKVKYRLCAHLNYQCDAPLDDHILAQKLMLEAAEDDFLKIANRHAA